jgi:hypothetical protein
MNQVDKRLDVNYKYLSIRAEGDPISWILLFVVFVTFPIITAFLWDAGRQDIPTQSLSVVVAVVISSPRGDSTTVWCKSRSSYSPRILSPLRYYYLRFYASTLHKKRYTMILENPEKENRRECGKHWGRAIFEMSVSIFPPHIIINSWPWKWNIHLGSLHPLVTTVLGHITLHNK